MKKSALVASALVLAALLVTPFVRGGDAEDRPRGVAPEAWIPLNDRIGIVVVAPAPTFFDKQGRPGVLPRSVPGYFMVKGATGWWARVEIVEPARAQPAHSPGAAD